MTTNDDTVQDSDVVDSTDVVDTSVEADNVISLMTQDVDICTDLTNLVELLKSKEDFKPNRAIVVLIDNNDQIGLFGYGRLHNAHQTVGILEQAKNTILNPQPIFRNPSEI